MYIMLLIVILIYHVIASVIDIKEINRLKNIKVTENTKVKYYKETILYSWIPVILVMIFVALTTLELNDIGFRMIDLKHNLWLTIITLIVSSGALLLLTYQTIMCIVSSEYQKQVEIIMNNKKESTNHYDRVVSNISIPKTNKEKKWFSLVSLTAGICEEIMWRGTIIFLLQTIFPIINIIVIFAISCILFGLLHSYQGIQGIIKTTIIAMLFVLLYYVTDSIIPGIVLHFIFDFSSTFLISDKDYTEKKTNNH